MPFREIKIKIMEKQSLWDTLTPMQQYAFLGELLRDFEDFEENVLNAVAGYEELGNG